MSEREKERERERERMEEREHSSFLFFRKWAQPLIDLGFNGCTFLLCVSFFVFLPSYDFSFLSIRHGLMHVLVGWHGLVAYRGMKMWNRERKYFL